MRILNIIQCSNLGGMEISTFLSLKYLKESGHEVMLVSLHPIGKLKNLLDKEKISYSSSGYKGLLGFRSIGLLNKISNEFNPELIVVTGHSIMSGFSILGAKATKINAIHFHHFEKPLDRVKWLIYYLISSRMFDYYTYASNYIWREAISVYRPIMRKSALLPNSFAKVDETTASSKDRARRQLGIPHDAFVIGNAGWLISRKRWDIFIEVGAIILEKIPCAMLIIAGDGPQAPDLVRFLESKNLSGRVLFLGWLPEMESFYRSIDVMLFNSDFDALGRSPLEAATYGVPVVSSVLKGGLGEVFTGLQYNSVFESHDVSGMVKKITDIYSDPKYGERMANELRERVAVYGDIAARCSSLMKIHASLNFKS